MGYLVMGGIALIAIAFILSVTIRFRTMEAVYYDGYGKAVKGRILEINTDSAQHHAAQKNQIYDIKVEFEYEGKEYEGEGTISSQSCSNIIGQGVSPAEIPQIAKDKEIQFFFDSMAPQRVIFYDPAEVAAKGRRNNKIAMVLLFAGLALFLAGRIAM